MTRKVIINARKAPPMAAPIAAPTTAPVVNFEPTPVVEVGTADAAVWTALWPVVVELVGDVDDVVVAPLEIMVTVWLAEVNEFAGLFAPPDKSVAIFLPYFSKPSNVKKSESNSSGRAVGDMGGIKETRTLDTDTQAGAKEAIGSFWRAPKKPGWL
jgi:hypothetical protein